MITELRKKWIQALRSGEFKQGRKVLRGTNEEGQIAYCCLGVLCELVHPDSEVIDDYQDTEELIPREVLGDYGITSMQQARLATLNDGGMVDGMAVREHDFSEIADYIETHLDKVV